MKFPAPAVDRVRHLVLDSIGNQFAGMASPTGARLIRWVEAQGGAPVLHRHRPGLSDHSGARHIGERRRLARAGKRRHRHLLEPSEQSAHRGRPGPGRAMGSSGRDVVAAWAIGWEVTAQTMKVCLGPSRQRADQSWLVQPGIPGDPRRGRARGSPLASRRRPDAGCSRPRSFCHGRNDEEPGDRHQRIHGRELPPCTASWRASSPASASPSDPDILDGELGVARLLGLENRGLRSACSTG